MRFIKYLIIFLAIALCDSPVSDLNKGLLAQWPMNSSQEVPTRAYMSDFTADVDGWDSTNVHVSPNIDGITDGTTSYDNTLRVWADATSSTHYIEQSLILLGKYYYLDCWVYVPSGQTSVDGFRLLIGGSQLLYDGSGENGAWVHIQEYFIAEDVNIRLVSRAGSGYTFIGADDVADDRMYLYDIKLNSIETPDVATSLNHATMNYVSYDTSMYGGLEQCMDFNGTSAYLDCGDPAYVFGDETNDYPFSVSVWVKADDFTNNSIISKYIDTTPNIEWLFLVTSDDSLQTVLYDNSTVNKIQASCFIGSSYDGEWVHLVFTYDGSGNESGIDLYINGVAQTEVKYETLSYTAMHNTTATITLGLRNRDGSGIYLDGLSDDLRIYQEALSQAKITALYEGGPK